MGTASDHHRYAKGGRSGPVQTAPLRTREQQTVSRKSTPARLSSRKLASADAFPPAAAQTQPVVHTRLTLQDLRRDSFPGQADASAGGSAQKGQVSLTASMTTTTTLATPQKYSPGEDVN